MDRLIDINDILAVREIASNIPATQINNAIDEAQAFDLVQGLGCDNSFVYYLSANQSVAKVVTLLDGASYSFEGKTYYFGGVKKALAYYAFARLLQIHNVRVTAAAVVTKVGDNSTTVDTGQLSIAAGNARSAGKQILEQCKEYLRRNETDWTEFECCGSEAPDAFSVTVIKRQGDGNRPI